MQTACIVSIGNELALGQSVDTNSAWVAAQLAAAGVLARRHITVHDEIDEIATALRQAADCAELVVVTGGLGPTEDDLTRQGLAHAAGVELETVPACVEQIRAFFVMRDRKMPEANLVQAQIPVGGQPIENTCGTAPGMRMELGGALVFVLPGVPFEMKTMFQRDVLPVVECHAQGRVLCGRVLRCFGAGESNIGQQIADLMKRDRNPTVGTTAELGVIGIRIVAAAATVGEAETLIDRDEQEIRTRLGEIVFGRDDDTLAAVVGRMLLDRKETVCTAESCTGGLVAAALTDISGSSAYFLGGAVTYSNELKTQMLGVDADLIKRLGAVSEPVAAAMAEGARQRLGTTYALSITGVAGPTGGTPDKPVGLVCFGLATPTGTQTREVRFASSHPREVVRSFASRTALNLLRLHLVRSAGAGGGD